MSALGSRVTHRGWIACLFAWALTLLYAAPLRGIFEERCNLESAASATRRQDIIIKVMSHEKNLMDPVPYGAEIRAIQGDPLQANQEPLPNVRS